MRNIYEILREKELQMKTLEKEIEALRVVARILQEEEDKGVSTGAPKLTSEPAWKITAPAATTETSRTYAPSPQPAAAVIAPEAEIKTQPYSATQQNAPAEAKPSRPWP